MESQFHKYYQMAEKSSNLTGEELLRLLERRLDNVVYRLGFSLSRPQARQLVNHGHFLINSRRVDISSYLVKEGDIVEVKKKSKKLPLIKEDLGASQKKKTFPEWLDIDKKTMRGTVRRFPLAEELDQEIDLSLIVGYYTR